MTAAIASSCFSPPESRCAGRSASAVSPNRASVAATRSAISAFGTPWCFNPNATSSATVGITICRSGSWKTNPTSLRTARPSRRVS